jgi:hypothetical protein
MGRRFGRVRGRRAYPNGAKAYVVQYRKSGRSRRSNIGDHGRLTPEEARSEAKKLLGNIERGEDPIAARRAERAARSFEEAASDFLSAHVKGKRKPSTHAAYKVLIKRHIVPAIGRIRLNELRRSHITRMHSGMSSTPGAANRAVSLVSAIWNFAAGRDEVPSAENPAKGATQAGLAGQGLTPLQWNPLSPSFASWVPLVPDRDGGTPTLANEWRRSWIRSPFNPAASVMARQGFLRSARDLSEVAPAMTNGLPSTRWRPVRIAIAADPR